MKKKLWFFLFAAPAFAICLIALKFYYLAAVWKYQGPDIEFSIRAGEPFSSINYRLVKQGIISSAKAFHRYTRVKNAYSQFKTGDYLIKSNSNMLDVFDTLVKGVPLATVVTIPEGKNLFEIAKILEEKKIAKYDEFVALAKDPNVTQALGIDAQRVEGYLYPETYHFGRSMKPKQIIETMVQTFKNKTKDLPWEKTDLDFHQLVTLASVVEKETGASFERPIIAGVFLNRLKKKMRLQSDPTTIYGIYEQFNGNLRKKHLQETTPYNTYRISGLPQGPICNPGIEALNAVIHPQKHRYLYFVSKNDGTHVFTETYRQHNEAVNEFQKTRANRQGKSWRDLKQSP